MNYHERQTMINGQNDGNHINADREVSRETEGELFECVTCKDKVSKVDPMTGDCEICIDDFYRKNFKEGK